MGERGKGEAPQLMRRGRRGPGPRHASRLQVIGTAGRCVWVPDLHGSPAPARSPFLPFPLSPFPRFSRLRYGRGTSSPGTRHANRDARRCDCRDRHFPDQRDGLYRVLRGECQAGMSLLLHRVRLSCHSLPRAGDRNPGPGELCTGAGQGPAGPHDRPTAGASDRGARPCARRRGEGHCTLGRRRPGGVPEGGRAWSSAGLRAHRTPGR